MRRRIAGAALSVLLIAGCGVEPTAAERDAVDAMVTQYLLDRAIRLTAAGRALDGQPLTRVRMDPAFAATVGPDAKKLDARRKRAEARGEGYLRAEVDVTIEELELDDDVATATVRDHTKLYVPSGDPETTEMATDRIFTLARAGTGWILTGARVDGVGGVLPETDFTS